MSVVAIPESALQALTAIGPMFFGRANVGPSGLHVVEYKNIEKRHLDNDQVRTDLIAWAARHGSGLVECHTHIAGDPACMSWTDVTGLLDWVPHVRWRLGGQPYAALVLGETTVDGVLWSAPDQRVEGVDALVLGPHRTPTTGRSLERFTAKDVNGAKR